MMVLAEEASIQKTEEKLKAIENFRNQGWIHLINDTHSSDISLTNFKQICVFPIPPIPCNRKNFLS